MPREILGDEGAELFTAEMLSRAATTPRDFDRLAAEDFVTFLEPPSRDDRIVDQYAIFSLMSSVAARLDSWLERHPAVYQRIIIPAELKWEARDKLDPANMTERVLYPGQAALSRWLKRHDTPRWSR